MSIRSIRWFLINQINDEPDLYGVNPNSIGVNITQFYFEEIGIFLSDSGSASIFSAGFGNFIHNVPCPTWSHQQGHQQSPTFMEILVKICENQEIEWHWYLIICHFLDSIRAHKGLHLKSLASTSGEEFRPVRWCRIVNTSSPARTSRSPFSCALVEVQDDFHHPDIASHGIGRWAVVSVLQLSHKKKKVVISRCFPMVIQDSNFLPSLPVAALC